MTFFGSLASAQAVSNALLEVSSSADEVATDARADDSDAAETVEQASQRFDLDELGSQEAVSGEEATVELPEPGPEASESEAPSPDDSVSAPEASGESVEQEESESPEPDVRAEFAGSEVPEPLVEVEESAAPAVEPEQPPSSPTVNAAPVEKPAKSASLKSLRLAEPMNDLAVVVGWNAPSGWGGRYLRHVDDTRIAVGVGLAPLTLWGIKLSLIVRRGAGSRSGFFQQLSVGFSTGAENYEAVVLDENGARTASLRKTAGRTVDLVLGYRWEAFSSSYAELFAGWSLNFQGTFLQRTNETLVPLPEETRDELEIQTPGGIILGLTFGWLL